MKKTLLFLVIVFAATTSLTAQVQKGDILLGATLGFNYGSQSNNYSSSNSNLSPRIGFGIGRNSVLGLRARVGYSTTKSETSDQKTKSTAIGAAAFWRRYIPIKSQIGWYLETNGGVNFSRFVTDYSPESKSTATQYYANVIPGFYYQALPKLLISADFGGLSYSHTRNKAEGTPINKASNVNFNMLSSFTFGVDFILGRK